MKKTTYLAPLNSKPSLNSRIPESTSEDETQDEIDPIDEASDESFPASDPPSSTGATASPSQPAESEKEF